jgi:hypothetical protein
VYDPLGYRTGRPSGGGGGTGAIDKAIDEALSGGKKASPSYPGGYRSDRSLSDPGVASLPKALQDSYLRGTYTPPGSASGHGVPGAAGTATTGVGGAGTGAAGAGTAKPPSLDFEAELDPYIQRQIQRYEQRFDVDNTKRAIDRSNLGIADAAALSAADAKANMASRGILGTGTGAAYLQKRIFEPARQQAAKAAADIAFANEQRLDALTLGGTGLMTAPSAIALGQQRLGLDAWSRAQEDARLRAAMEQSTEAARRAEELARLQMILNLADDAGSEYEY